MISLGNGKEKVPGVEDIWRRLSASGHPFGYGSMTKLGPRLINCVKEPSDPLRL